MHSGFGRLLLHRGEVVAALPLYGAHLDIYTLLVFSASIQFHRRNQGTYKKVAKLFFFFFWL